MAEHTPEPWVHCPRDPHYPDAVYMVWTGAGPGHGIVAHTHPYGVPYYAEERRLHETDAARIVARSTILPNHPDPATAVARLVVAAQAALADLTGRPQDSRPEVVLPLLRNALAPFTPPQEDATDALR